MSLREVAAAGRIRAYFPLSEVAGPARDTYGRQNAADTTGVDSAAGLIYPLSRVFDNSNPDRLVAPASGLFGVPSSGILTIAGWSYLSVHPAAAGFNFFGVWGLPSSIVYTIQVADIGGSTIRYRALVGNSDGDNTGITLTWPDTPATSTWHFIIVELNESADFASIEVNRTSRQQDNGLSYELAEATSDLWLGSDEATENDYTGRLQGWTFIDGLLSTAEKDEMYASGAGFDLNRYLLRGASIPLTRLRQRRAAGRA